MIVYERHIGWGFLCGSVSKESSHNAGNLGLIPRLGRFPGEGNGNPLNCSNLENPMDGGPGGLKSMGSQLDMTEVS